MAHWHPFAPLMAVACLLWPAAGLSQTVSNWLEPTSGAWANPANWSTDPFAPVASGYEAVIGATGAPYSVTIDTPVGVDRLAIDSPDAEVILNGGTLTATQGVWANAAPLVLAGGTVSNTLLAGEAGVLAQRNTDVTLDGVTLATTLQGDARSLDLKGQLVLDEALIVGDDLGITLHGDTALGGQGEIRYTNTYSRRLYVDGVSPQPVLGEGVALRATASGTLYVQPAHTQTGSELLTNRGVIEAVGSGTIVFDSYLSVANEGVLRAVGGGRLFVNGFRSNRSVGEIEIGEGSEVHFSGNYVVGQPVEVPQNGDLGLWGSWRIEAPVTVQPGAVVGVGGSTTAAGAGNWTWGDGAAVEVRSAWVRPSTLLNMETTPTTEIRFRYDGELDLSGEALDLNDIPGRWNLASSHFRDGTITGLPNAGVIGDASDYVSLENIVLDAPLRIDAGVVSAWSSFAIDRPVVVGGGTLRLRDAWSNAGGLTVDGGRLELLNYPADPASIGSIMVRAGVVALPAMPADPSVVQFDGGELEIGFNTTLAALRDLPTTPTRVSTGYRSTYSRYGTIDLEQEVVDVAGQPFEIDLNNGGLKNGTLWKSTDDGPWRVGRGTLEDVVVQTDIEADSLTLAGETEVQHVRLAGEIRTSGTGVRFTGATIDGQLTIGGDVLATESLTVHGGLQLDRSVLRFVGSDAFLGGGGEASTSGIRGQLGGGIEVEAGSLTIGPGFTFHSRRNGSSITVAAGDLINNGVLRAGVDWYGSSYHDVDAPSITISLGGLSYNNRTLHQNGLLQIEDGYEVRVNAGSIANAGVIELQGGLLAASEADLTSSGEIRGDGVIVSFAGEGLQSSGAIAPGDHAVTDDDGVETGYDRLGMLQLVGDYSETEAASLRIDLAGPDPAAGYDRLVVTGAAEIAGSLEVSLLDDYDPLAGQTFEVLTAGGGLSGQFSQVALPTLTGGRDWLVEYLATSVRLRVLGLPGDYNADGLVTQDDLAAYREEYGAVGVGLMADGNGDGVVNAADYTVWRDALEAAPETTAVPEPATWGVACVALLAGRLRRRRA